jgi:cell wall-associated NlpC family hydrolase
MITRQEKIIRLIYDQMDKILESPSSKAYRYGGVTPSEGYECTGLITWLLNRSGIRLAEQSAKSFYELCQPDPDRRWGTGLAETLRFAFTDFRKQANSFSNAVNPYYYYPGHVGMVVGENSIESRIFESTTYANKSSHLDHSFLSFCQHFILSPSVDHSFAENADGFDASAAAYSLAELIKYVNIASNGAANYWQSEYPIKMYTFDWYAGEYLSTLNTHINDDVKNIANVYYVMRYTQLFIGLIVKLFAGEITTSVLEDVIDVLQGNFTPVFNWLYGMVATPTWLSHVQALQTALANATYSSSYVFRPAGVQAHLMSALGYTFDNGPCVTKKRTEDGTQDASGYDGYSWNQLTNKFGQLIPDSGISSWDGVEDEDDYVDPENYWVTMYLKYDAVMELNYHTRTGFNYLGEAMDTTPYRAQGGK